MPELSVCVVARNEEWLRHTVADIVNNSRADTDVIVVFDGEYPDLTLIDGLSVVYLADGAWEHEPWSAADRAVNPKVIALVLPEPIGQRAATNLAFRFSRARYAMKVDAHCSFAEGFDRVLVDSAQELGPNVVQIPAQRNLHVFDWVCDACGRREYQCGLTECRVCYSKDIRKEVVWKPRGGTRMIRWRLDSELHYQGWGGIPATDYVETMSCLGACWFVAKDYWEFLEGLDEDHGSWGQVGCELACKTWLSGGRMVTNTKTDYAHFFRVGGQKFPYEITGQEQDYARQYSRNLWRGNHWPKQVRPLKWLVDHFWPVPGWTEEQRDALPGRLGRLPSGEPVGLFDGGTPGHAPERDDESGAPGSLGGLRGRVAGAAGLADHADYPLGVGPPSAVCGQLQRVAVPVARPPSKGIVYYSDCRLRSDIAEAALDTIRASGLPIVAVTIPREDGRRGLIEGARNIHLDLTRGYLTMFKQILAGLELLETDVAFLCEHDVLYHPSHFAFTPSMDRVFYNRNVWKVDAASGRALHYLCSQTSGLCASRELLVEHYRKRVSLVEQHGFSRKMGFEPATHRRAERVDDLRADVWMSDYPNVDIRHTTNLTSSRWSQDQFRDKRNCQGWTEGTGVPGWGETLGRFDDFLREASAAQQAVA